MNPFPDKWYIEVCEEVGLWLNDLNNCDFYHATKFRYLCYPAYKYSNIFNDPPSTYTHISLNEFKKYVLKENIKEFDNDYSYLIDLFAKLNINYVS